MKNRPDLLITIMGLLTLTACKKQNISMTATPQLETGRYQEIKLRIYRVEGPNILSDTTYYNSTFSANDYVNFINGICTVSTSYGYNPQSNSPRLSKSSSTLVETYNYSFQDSVYLLSNPNPTLVPSGIYSDTVKSAGNTILLLRSVYVDPIPTSTIYAPETFVDAYYTQP